MALQLHSLCIIQTGRMDGEKKKREGEKNKQEIGNMRRQEGRMRPGKAGSGARMYGAIYMERNEVLARWEVGQIDGQWRCIVLGVEQVESF